MRKKKKKISRTALLDKTSRARLQRLTGKQILVHRQTILLGHQPEHLAFCTHHTQKKKKKKKASQHKEKNLMALRFKPLTF
jgi:hypothetical protein